MIVLFILIVIKFINWGLYRYMKDLLIKNTIFINQFINLDKQKQVYGN